MNTLPDLTGEPSPCPECERQIDYDYAREDFIHLDGTPCALYAHEYSGHYVTVWIKGMVSQDDADAMVERLVATPPPGVVAAVVRG
jgi:hypothetical protein